MSRLLTYWSFDLSSLVLLLMMLMTAAITKAFLNKKLIIFTFALLILCLFSPLHVLSSQYLFSAHMMIHVILLLFIGPSMVISLPPDSKNFEPVFSFLERHPVAAWLAGIGIMWFWHIPAIFNSAMSSMHRQNFNLLPVVELLSLIFAGILFSAPVVHPNKHYRVDPLSGVAYLFTACIGCSLLGLLITFAPVDTYHHFLSMHDKYDLNKTILQNGITQAIDQQAAGLIMWVPCCFIYVTAAMYLLVRWFNHKEDATVLIEQL
jgi:putative membrane protein